MPTYKVVFTNGEKRELIVKAAKLVSVPGILKLVKDDGSLAAIVPTDKLLYVQEVRGARALGLMENLPTGGTKP